MTWSVPAGFSRRSSTGSSREVLLTKRTCKVAETAIRHPLEQRAWRAQHRGLRISTREQHQYQHRRQRGSTTAYATRRGVTRRRSPRSMPLSERSG